MRVRLTRIEGVDLGLFDFDLDLTLMMFFLNDKDQIYARYGGRDGKDADNRQSLAGLRSTMQSVLEMHQAETKMFAPRRSPEPKFAGQSFGGKGRCMHCHQAKEQEYGKLTRAGSWDRELVYRFPLPDNLGIVLDVDKSNLVKKVPSGSPADKAGLKPGDRLRSLAGVPIHSFGDAQFALDRTLKKSTVPITWQREGTLQQAELILPEGWRQTDISWRRSVNRWVPNLTLVGDDLTPPERKDLGLSPKQLAFRQRDRIHSNAAAAGFRPGDIILGIDDGTPEMNYTEFYFYVRTHYLVGDRLPVQILREGERLKIELTLK